MEGIQNLKMTLHADAYNDTFYEGYDGTFSVGVMEDGNFVELASASPDRSNFQPYTFYFYPYQGTGNRIAIKMEAASSETGQSFYRGVFIDDITVEHVTGCFPPVQAAVSDIAAHSATVSWLSHSDIQQSNLYVKKHSEAVFSVFSNVTSPFTLSDLESGENYDIFVESVCAAGNSVSDTIFFTTDCETITQFPWTEDFEGALCSDNSSFVNNLPPCWYHINTSSAYPGTPSVSCDAANARSGEKVLLFYSQYNYTDLQDQYAVSPSMENLHSLRVTIHARRYLANYEAVFHVGVMEGDHFVEVQTFSPASGEYAPFTAYFDQYTGTGDRIAIKSEMPTSENFYYGLLIDDISVEQIPSCAAPSNVVASLTTDSTATVSWNKHSTGDCTLSTVKPTIRMTS